MVSETTSKMKRQHTECKKIFAYDICDRLIPIYIKNSYNSTLKKQTAGLKNGQRTGMVIFAKTYSWSTDT